MKACALEYAAEIRRSLDQDKPGWAVELIHCPQHGGYHELRPAGGQMFSCGANGQDGGSAGRPLVRFRLLEGGLRCFHDGGTEPISAPCAYCGAVLHVHKDALGRVKSGRHGTGYLKEKCPACHRANAVFPAYGLGGIRVAKLAEGTPAMQMKLG